MLEFVKAFVSCSALKPKGQHWSWPLSRLAETLSLTVIMSSPHHHDASWWAF